MCQFRDAVIFFAGAQFFHTLDHALIPVFVKMPLDLGFMVLTQKINFAAIGINALITAGLLYWAHRLGNK